MYHEKETLENFHKETYMNIHPMYGFTGGTGGRDLSPPLNNHKHIGFLSNTGPDLSGQLKVVLWFFLPSSTKKRRKRKCYQIVTTSDKTF